MSGEHMRRYWDERARENAAYFVDNQLDYNRTDMDQFWAGGPATVDQVLAAVSAPGIESGDVVLEIGCGIGRLTRVLADRAQQVIALDVSVEMLTRASAANPQLGNVEWLNGDGTSLAGVPDASVDVVFSHVVFQHIPDPQVTLGYIREMGRVLRQGGWAAFQISNDADVHRTRQPLLGTLKSRLARGPRGQDDPAWRGSSVKLDDLRAVASESGLAVAEIANPGTQFCFVRLGRARQRARPDV